MEMLEGKKLTDSIEDKLADALGGDKQLVRDFLQAKRDGKHMKKYEEALVVYTVELFSASSHNYHGFSPNSFMQSSWRATT